MSTIITSLDPRSPAQRAGVRCGEKLIAINGHTVTDVLDYRFFGYDSSLELVLESDLFDGQSHALLQSLPVLFRGPDGSQYALHSLF